MSYKPPLSYRHMKRCWKSQHLRPISASSALTIIVAVMVTGYLTANVMASKLIHIAGITIFDAGTLVFPLTYLLGDVLTEIWGFKTTRRVIWLTFACQLFFALFCWVAVLLPAPPNTADTATAFAQIFTFVPRIVAASLSAFLVGELVNAWSFLKIRKRTGEGRLWLRTIGSTFYGCVLDTGIFVTIAFWGVVPPKDILSMFLIQVAAKMLIEACASTPMAYILIHQLKKRIAL